MSRVFVILLFLNYLLFSGANCDVSSRGSIELIDDNARGNKTTPVVHLSSAETTGRNNNHNKDDNSKLTIEHGGESTEPAKLVQLGLTQASSSRGSESVRGAIGEPSRVMRMNRDKRSPQSGISRRKMPKVLLAQRPRTTSTTTTTTTTTTSASPTTTLAETIEEEEEEEEEGERDAEPENRQDSSTSATTKTDSKQEFEEYDADTESSEEVAKAPVPETTTEPSKPAVSKSRGKQSTSSSKGRVSTMAASEGGGKKKTTPAKENKSEQLGEQATSSTASPVNSTTKTTGKQQAISMVKKKKPLVALPFIKPKNASICTPEAYLEFPRDLIGNKWRARGLVIIHILVVCYMFYALALVCERYFMPSLEEFAQRLHLSDDVAGATLMSAGSSAPELFTAILGVFIAKGDVGTGAIVGSAVFNILFVIGICAFVSTTSAQLAWWPVLRDSVFYTFTVLVLIVFIWDERVTTVESSSMLCLYGLYILVMVHNETCREYVTKALLSHPFTSNLISPVGAVGSVDGADDVFGGGGSSVSGSTINKISPRNYQTTSMTTHKSGSLRTVEEDSMFLAAMLIIVQHKRLFRSQLRFQSAARYIITKRQHSIQQQQQQQQQLLQQQQSNITPRVTSNEVNYFGPECEPLKSSTNQKERMEAYARTATLSKSKFSIVSKDDYEFWNRPPQEGENYYIWLAKIPVNYVLHYTIPDSTLYPDKYLFSFLISIAWTAFFSYIMVWMVTLIGYTFGIPDSVMGFTFLAAGTSIPDCYSSIHAARNGMADMAVSNSIGSNVFDILIGLSLPWFIQTAIYPGVVATINSRGIIYSVILLFLSLVVTIYLMNKYEWTLKPRLGLALLIAYGLFIVLTCMLEFNLFGHVNPPPCPVLA